MARGRSRISQKGALAPGLRQPIILAIVFRKLHEIEKKMDQGEGRVSSAFPLESVNRSRVYCSSMASPS